MGCYTYANSLNVVLQTHFCRQGLRTASESPTMQNHLTLTTSPKRPWATKGGTSGVCETSADETVIFRGYEKKSTTSETVPPKQLSVIVSLLFSNAQCILERLNSHWLDQMGYKTRGFPACNVFFHAVTGKSDPIQTILFLKLAH
jgi:hypothetical protein